ncbi:c-type cytochrome [Sphingobium nicotianae]|uniref:Cytochrome c n=1 Tax=Sphingobium nicotianae TaxID=2782607 RepID=A0A9X1IRN1_9SPHN|nr:cytochrome c [Sphingobium nicotianae]MBT2187603.1 cytochrome c [Sphingobium nicotianae]
MTRRRMRRASAIALPLAAILCAWTVGGRAQDTAGGGPSSVKVGGEGKEVFETICQACHLADAKGGSGIPALAGNTHLADKDFMVDILLKGRGGMPWFNDMLTPKQIAAVATYVRSHFNSYSEPVTEADVQRIAGGAKASPRDCATC